MGKVRHVHARADAADKPRILSPRQRQVAACAARGLSNAEIASELALTTKAVEKHLSFVYQKLGIASRTKLVAYMARSAVR
jgi:DNA-binding NarL/FixJ family response regulator